LRSGSSAVPGEDTPDTAQQFFEAFMQREIVVSILLYRNVFKGNQEIIIAAITKGVRCGRPKHIHLFDIVYLTKSGDFVPVLFQRFIHFYFLIQIQWI
jgi:hypothetical protein